MLNSHWTHYLSFSPPTIIVESRSTQKSLTSYGVAPSAIFCMIVLNIHTQLFGLNKQKFVSAILVFGGHFGFLCPKMTYLNINGYRIKPNEWKMLLWHQVIPKWLYKQNIKANVWYPQTFLIFITLKWRKSHIFDLFSEIHIFIFQFRKIWLIQFLFLWTKKLPTCLRIILVPHLWSYHHPKLRY